MSGFKLNIAQHVAESGAVYDKILKEDMVRLIAHVLGEDAAGIRQVVQPRNSDYFLIFRATKAPKVRKPKVSEGAAGPAVSVAPKQEAAAAPVAPAAPPVEAPAPAATPDLAAVLANPTVLALLQSLGGLAGLAPVVAPTANPEPAHKPLSLGKPVKGKGKRAA